MQKQPKDIRTKFEHIFRLIQANGLERVHEPYIKYLEGGLWEMRMKGKDTIARAIYVTAIGKRIIVVRVFSRRKAGRPRAMRSKLLLSGLRR